MSPRQHSSVSTCPGGCTSSKTSWLPSTRGRPAAWPNRRAGGTAAAAARAAWARR
jgi:hypothetical protein